MSVEVRELDLGDQRHRRGGRRAPARVLPRRGGPARRAHAARAEGVPAAAAPQRRALPRRLRGRPARRRGVVEAQRPAASTSTGSSCTPTASAAASPGACSTRWTSSSPTRSARSWRPARPTRPRAASTSAAASCPVEERARDGSITIVTYERAPQRHDARRVRRRPASRPDAGAAPHRDPRRARRGRCWCSPASGSRALSLLGPSSPTYDPWAWIIWGREIGSSTSTRSAARRGSRCRCSSPPSSRSPATTRRRTCGWSSRAPAGCSRSRWRTGSARGSAAVPAGVIAALALLLADEYIRNFWRGNSEGMLVARLPVGGRAPPRRPPHRRLPARLRRRAAAAGGVAVLRPLRAVARVDRAAPARARRRRLRGQRRSSGSRPSTGARATGCAPPTARTSRTPTRPRSPTARSSRCSRARRRSSRAGADRRARRARARRSARGGGTCGCRWPRPPRC